MENHTQAKIKITERQRFQGCASLVLAKIVRAASVTGIVNFPTIPEAASYAQFERYLSAKDVEIEDIYSNQQMVVSHLKKFLEDTYPGLDTQPSL